MIKVIGVRFRQAGKIYYFSPGKLKINRGDHVIVETARGVEYGKVVLAPKDVVDDQVVHPLKEVLRVATKDDDEREKYNRERERDAFKICQKKIREHGLEMKLIDAEYTFDNNKVLFYFTADGRIDFRQLVKDLASIFKTRIELRQIGVRDEAKTLRLTKIGHQLIVGYSFAVNGLKCFQKALCQQFLLQGIGSKIRIQSDRFREFRNISKEGEFEFSVNVSGRIYPSLEKIFPIKNVRCAFGLG